MFYRKAASKYYKEQTKQLKNDVLYGKTIYTKLYETVMSSLHYKLFLPLTKHMHLEILEPTNLRRILTRLAFTSPTTTS